MAEYGEPLTQREQELVGLVATGVTNREIARQLHISVNTVKVHLRNIFTKLGAESRTEATVIAAREGLIDLELANEPEPVEAPEPAEGQSEPSLRPPLPWSKRSALLAAALLAIIMVFITWPPSQLASEDRINPPQDSPPDSAAPYEASDSAWVEHAQMPTRRAYLALAATGTQLVAIGGRTADGTTAAVEVYDISKDIWHRTTDKPVPVAYVSAAVIASDIYVPGGRDSENSPTNVVEVFDTMTESWRQVQSLPGPRYAYATTALDSYLYLFGGWDGEQYVASVYSYDAETDAWTRETPMQTPRGFAAAAPLNGKLYVVGGYDGTRELKTCEFYDPQSGVWESCPPLNTGRGGLGLVSLGQQLFAIGGGGWTSYLGFNEKYNPGSDGWTTIETPLVGEWRSPGVAAIGNTVYTVGGWSSGPLATNQSFDALPFRVFIPISSSDAGEE
ncbi:MAG: LuxR C-terminal-related transcriptional regulator [Anaerolineae bacterium]|nr:LuxR C-terminal-related transcriptional regulator [Anaerolineae bacterium]